MHLKKISLTQGEDCKVSPDIKPVFMVGGPRVDLAPTDGENQSKVENALLSKFREEWETSCSLSFALDVAKAITKYGREFVEGHRSAVRSGQQKAISGAFCNDRFGKVFVELEKMQRESYASVSKQLNEKGGYESSEYKHMYDACFSRTIDKNTKSLILKLIPDSFS